MNGAAADGAITTIRYSAAAPKPTCAAPPSRVEPLAEAERANPAG